MTQDPPMLEDDLARLLELWRPSPCEPLHLVRDVMDPMREASGRSFLSPVARLLALGIIAVEEDPYVASLTDVGKAWLSA